MYIEKEKVLNLKIEAFIQNSLIDMNSAIIGLPFKYAFKIKTFIMNIYF